MTALATAVSSGSQRQGRRQLMAAVDNNDGGG